MKSSASVRMVGLEPTRACAPPGVNELRLPVPPHPHHIRHAGAPGVLRRDPDNARCRWREQDGEGEAEVTIEFARNGAKVCGGFDCLSTRSLATLSVPTL